MAASCVGDVPLTLSEIQEYTDSVKTNGIRHFIQTYKDNMQMDKFPLKWGDEVEYMIVHFDHVNRKVQLSLSGGKVLDKLTETQNCRKTLSFLWSKEFGSYMLESSPGKPYSGILSSCLDVEANMRSRRKEIQKHLNPDDAVVTLTTFPRLGCPDFTHPLINISDPGSNLITHSLFFPDDAIAEDTRCRQAAAGIFENRGGNATVNIPLFRDINTPSPFVEDFNDTSANQRAMPDHVYLDSIGFGAGNCCIQCTVQAANIDEAKYLYDQLATLCPIMLALTAASPIQRGYLVDTDTRWQMFVDCLDDRTDGERGLNVNKQTIRVHTPRTSSIRNYLSNDDPQLNDVALELNKRVLEMMDKEGVESSISRHFAHLWIRRLLSLERSQTVFTPQLGYQHFENIQTSNWQTVRFKPPPPDTDIGWRVEFRVMEAQLTDFENAAFVIFVILFTRVILDNQLDLLIPISMIDENMERAQQNNAVLTQKFYFNHNLNFNLSDNCVEKEIKQPISEMTVDEIINGKVDQFPGFVFLSEEYLKNNSMTNGARRQFKLYLDFISKKASGEIPTTAQRIRKFVTLHPEYARDSRVSTSMTYDLLMSING